MLNTCTVVFDYYTYHTYHVLMWQLTVVCFCPFLCRTLITWKTGVVTGREAKGGRPVQSKCCSVEDITAVGKGPVNDQPPGTYQRKPASSLEGHRFPPFFPCGRAGSTGLACLPFWLSFLARSSDSSTFPVPCARACACVLLSS